VTEVARKLLKGSRRYKEFSVRSQSGKITDFIVDSFLLPSPYASSFGGFVELATTIWFAAGGVITSIFDTVTRTRQPSGAKPGEGEVPADMSTMSLLGGGLIAGDSLAALSIGIYGLLKTVL
jgi:hypothetical protein